MTMIPVVLLTLVFTYGGGLVKLTTEVDTVVKCEKIIQQLTANVGKDKIKVAKCEEKYRVVE